LEGELQRRYLIYIEDNGRSIKRKATNPPGYFGARSLRNIQKDSLKNVLRMEEEYRILKLSHNRVAIISIPLF
jgi:hypothetical protein